MFIALNETYEELQARHDRTKEYVLKNMTVDSARFAREMSAALSAQDYIQFNFLLSQEKYETAHHVNNALKSLVTTQKVLETRPTAQ